MPATLHITAPRDGDILNRHDGIENNGQIMVTVRGTAPAGVPVTVNGVQATVQNGQFSCTVPLTRRRNIIVARAGNLCHEIMVWWNKGSRKRYRFSVDDNILFLKDLGLNADQFASIFDHWYLAFWREMHDEYGAKIHINIYYQTEGFDLTQMPDKWKDEWQENASWLHLSFHALADAPSRPYRNATYAQMAHDYDLVCGHIRRFAGNEVLSNTTTVHWAECPQDAILALRDRGIERLIGLFWVKDGVCTTGYYLTPEECAYCNTRDAWYDRRTGLMFIACDAVVNSLEVEQVVPHLEAQAASPHTGEMMELLIHEQYFRQEWQYYQPTVQQKVRTALAWVTDRGYEPVFWGDGFLGTVDS